MPPSSNCKHGKKVVKTAFRPYLAFRKELNNEVLIPPNLTWIIMHVSELVNPKASHSYSNAGLLSIGASNQTFAEFPRTIKPHKAALE